VMRSGQTSANLSVGETGPSDGTTGPNDGQTMAVGIEETTLGQCQCVSCLFWEDLD